MLGAATAAPPACPHMEDDLRALTQTLLSAALLLFHKPERGKKKARVYIKCHSVDE